MTSKASTRASPPSPCQGGRGWGLGVSLLLLLVLPVFATDQPTRLAQRGVEAYRAGNLDMARLFFERAYRQSALLGRSDWMAAAICNLADVALEAREWGEAEHWLELAPESKGPEYARVLWKRSQLLYARRQPREAVALLDSSRRLHEPRGIEEVRMESDRLRYLYVLEDSATWERRLAEFQRGLKASHRREILPLRAWSRLRRADYAAAESLWSKAADFHRSQHRPLAVGESLSYRALCLHALNRQREAQQSAAQAEGVFDETGFAAGKLRAQALQILLADEPVAKSRPNGDFLSEGPPGGGVRELLDDYAQIYPPLLGRLELFRGR